MNPTSTGPNSGSGSRLLLAFLLLLAKKVNLKYASYATWEKWGNRPKIYSLFKTEFCVQPRTVSSKKDLHRV